MEIEATASKPASKEFEVPAMDTAEPLSKKRRVTWIDETLRKPLQEVRFIPKENIGKRYNGHIVF